MNFIDKYKQELESNESAKDTEEMDIDSDFSDEDMAQLNTAFLKKIMPGIKSVDEVKKENRDFLVDYADIVSEMALVVQNKLKGKYTSKDMTNLVTAILGLIGGR